MPDYKEPYLHAVHEIERAVRILIEAQQVCKEMVLREEEPKIMILPENTPDA